MVTRGGNDKEKNELQGQLRISHECARRAESFPVLLLFRVERSLLPLYVSITVQT